MLDVRWLLVGYAMEGLSGSMIAAISTSQAYITDVAHPSDRARLFSYLQAVVSFACAAGPIVAGVVLATPNSLEVIYRFVVCIHFLLVLIFLFVLPESRWSRRSDHTAGEGFMQPHPPEDSYMNVILKSVKSLLFSRAFRQKNVFLLAGMDSAVFGIIMALPALQLAYPAYLFGWEPTAQSFYVALFYSWSILVLVVIFPMLMDRVPRWASGMRFTNMSAVLNGGEVGAMRVSLVLQKIGYMGMAFARAPSSFIISSLLVASGSPVAPLLTSCLTAQVPRHQSGQLLGMLSFLHAIARILVPAAMNLTYSMTIGISPAPLFVLLAVTSAALLVASMHIKTNAL